MTLKEAAAKSTILAVWKCRYCKQTVTVTEVGQMLPRDRCSVGSTPHKSGSHLWKHAR